MRGEEDVAAALRERGVAHRQIRAAAARADQAARSLGVEQGAIVKSLLFLADGQPVLVLVAGDRRADPKRLCELLGARRVMIASRERVMEETGYGPGAVPPIGLARELPVWVDEALSAYEKVYASGGAKDVIIELSFADMVALTAGRLADVSGAE
jgi:Cys-tRNA(Pro) deacylase